MGWGRSQETHIPTAHGRTVGLPETKMEAAILKKLKNELQVWPDTICLLNIPNLAHHLYFYGPQAKNAFYIFKWLHYKRLYKYQYSILYFISWFPQRFIFLALYEKLCRPLEWSIDGLKHFSNSTQYPIKMGISCYRVVIRSSRQARQI